MADSEANVQIEGLADLQRKLANLQSAVNGRVRQFLFRKGEEIAGQAKEITPVDTGALRSSIRSGVPEGAGEGAIEIEISAGGPSIPYAIYVHENLKAHHPVGEAKFLEKPAIAAAKTFAQDLVGVLNADDLARNL